MRAISGTPTITVFNPFSFTSHTTCCFHGRELVRRCEADRELFDDVDIAIAPYH